MTRSSTKNSLVAQRAEIMAELLLQELGPHFVARNAGVDSGYDLFVGFDNPKGGVNMVAVQVKATAQPVKGRFRLQRKHFDMLANSNIPVLLLVINVKQNEFFYALLKSGSADPSAKTVAVPISKLDDSAKAELASRFAA